MKRKTKRKKPQETLGNRIRSARTRKGFTQLALAHAIGYSGDDAGAFISRVENDVQAPRIDNLRLIAEALGVSIASLIS